MGPELVAVKIVGTGWYVDCTDSDPKRLVIHTYPKLKSSSPWELSGIS